MEPRKLGLLLIAAGFVIAVPAAYTVATMSDEQLLRLIRALIVLALISLGSLAGATGIILAWYRREE